jgi:hypothetical protein
LTGTSKKCFNRFVGKNAPEMARKTKENKNGPSNTDSRNNYPATRVYRPSRCLLKNPRQKWREKQRKTKMKHKTDCKKHFGHLDASCPRCAELLAGAVPTSWKNPNASYSEYLADARKRADLAARRAAIYKNVVLN